MSKKTSKKIDSEYRKIIHRLKRYYFHEKRITNRLFVTDKEIISIFFSDFGYKDIKNNKRFLISINRNQSNPVLSAKTFNRPQSQEEWKEIYDNYLLSDKWKNKRLQLFKIKGRKCEVCGSTKKIDVHHKHYERLTCELLSDLSVLCRSCHEKEHSNLKSEQDEKYLSFIMQRRSKKQPKFRRRIHNKNEEYTRYKRNGRIIIKHIE